MDIVKEQKTRRAIIIGINKYESDHTIPTLKGAENDASEIRDRLIKYGNFEIPKNHYLIGSDATRKNILKAVSEVFQKDNTSDLILFYFSGQVIIDKRNSLFLVPYDIDPKDPFISSINVEDLKKVILNSNNKTSIIFILDCCYSGVITKEIIRAETLSEYEYLKNLYSTNLKKIIESSTQGQGKIVLASSEATAVSREKNNCIHSENDPPHSHGAFSYHLIEGLDGKAADPATGIITIDNLKKYIEYQMTIEGKQTPIYYIVGASNIENIKIAVSKKAFNAKISYLIKAAENFCSIKDPLTNLIDLQDIDNAAKKVYELMNLDPNNKEIPRLQAIIDDALNMYKQFAMEWIDNNIMVARLKINEIKPGLYDYELPNLFDSLSFNELSKIDPAKLRVLIHLSSEITRNTRFESPDDRNLKILIAKLRAAFGTNRTSKYFTVDKT